MACQDTTCGCNTVHGRGNWLWIILVLYILLAIILGSAIAC